LPSLTTREQLINRARRVSAKKRLGQNFFIDADRLDRIVDALSLSASDHVLEIGPGLGFLTDRLTETGARVTAVELDGELVPKLRNEFGRRAEIIHANFLDFDIGSLTPVPNKIVGNIPYQITSPICAHIFGEIGEPSPWSPKIELLVMTVQFEVAERLLAKPGTKAYSHLTVLKDYLFDVEFLFKVPPDSFWPIPEVTSAVVRCTPLPAPPVVCRDMRLFKRILQTGFKQRRKMLKNNLSFLHLDEQKVTELMRKARINPLARAEDLSIQQFALLSDILSEHIAHPGDDR